MIPGVMRVQIVSEPIENYFTQPNELVQAVREVKKSFGSNTRVSVITIEAQGSRTVLDPPALEMTQKITNQLRTAAAIRRDTILSLTTMQEVKSDGTGALETVPLIEKIPQDYFEHKTLVDKVKKNDLVYKRLIGKDLKMSLIVAAAQDGTDLFDVHQQLQKIVGPYLTKEVHDSGYSVHIAGDNEVFYQLQANVQKDALIFAVIGLLMIIISFYFMFRTWKGVVLPFSATFVGVVWTMGLIGYYGEPISMLSAMLPVVLVVSGSAYAIHVFHFLEEHALDIRSFRAALRKVFRRMFSPLFLSALTTFIGGITLLAFEISMIQHFGVFTAIGSIITFIVCILVIPSFYKILRTPIQRLERKIEKSVVHGVSSAKHIANATMQAIPIAGPVTTALAETVSHSVTGGLKGFFKELKNANLIERLLKAISKVVLRFPVQILVFAALLIGFSISQMRHLQIGFDNISMLPDKFPLKQITKRIEKTFNGIQTFEILVDTKKPNGLTDPQTLKQIDRFIKEVSRNKDVTNAFSVIDLLEKVHKTLADPKSNETLPSSKEAIAQYLFLLSSSANTNLGTMITSDHQRMKIRLAISISDTRDTEKLYNEIQITARRYFEPNIAFEIGGGPAAMIGALRYIVWGKIQNIFASLLILILLFSLLFRSMSRSLISVLTLPLGVFSTFGLMGVTGIRLDMITAIITSFAMGIGVDFSIHWLAAFENEHKRHKNLDVAIEKAILGPGKVILYDAIATIIGFSVLFISQFKSIQIFATLLCFNMFLLALGSISLVPAAIKVFKPGFIYGSRSWKHFVERRFSTAMKIAFHTVIIGILCAGIAYTEAKAEELPSPETLLKKSVQAVHTNNEESVYVMKLIGSGGDISTRKMKVWFKSKGENDAKLLIKFIEPADIRGTGFLTLAEKGKDPDQYLYLPVLKKSRRIKGGNMDEPFLGSDFSMGDLSVDKTDSLSYKVEGVKPCEGGECFVVVGTPKEGTDSSSLTYSKKIFYIRKDNYMGIKGEYFNPSGQLEKVLTLQRVHQDGKRWLADAAEMKNLLTKHSTVIEFEKREFNKVQPDHIFSVNFLER